MAFHALADYQNHVIGWLQWEQSSLGDGAVVRFPRIWMSSGECRLKVWWVPHTLSIDINKGTRDFGKDTVFRLPGILGFALCGLVFLYRHWLTKLIQELGVIPRNAMGSAKPSNLHQTWIVNTEMVDAG